MSNGVEKKETEIEQAHAELDKVKDEIRGDVVTWLRSWAAGASTPALSGLFAVLTALGWARDLVDGIFSSIPLVGTVFSAISAALSNFDESLVAVPWFLVLCELIYRYRTWRGRTIDETDRTE